LIERRANRGHSAVQAHIAMHIARAHNGLRRTGSASRCNVGPVDEVPDSIRRAWLIPLLRHWVLSITVMSERLDIMFGTGRTLPIGMPAVADIAPFKAGHNYFRYGYVRPEGSMPAIG
jgi:hypothetical protein